MTISRLRAGLAITFAAVSLMAGAQAAEACTEPTLGDLPARGEEKQLVRFELAGLTPGSEYLVKVNGRERKSGVATTDKVSRRFRMPHMGDSNRRVKVEVVIANDACETSPWKLEEKMTYQPAPAPEPPRSSRAHSHAVSHARTRARARRPLPRRRRPRASRTRRRPRRRSIHRRFPSRRSRRRPRRRTARRGSRPPRRGVPGSRRPTRTRSSRTPPRSSTTPRSRGSTARRRLPTAPLR